jgi:hypothetical protein
MVRAAAIASWLIIGFPSALHIVDANAQRQRPDARKEGTIRGLLRDAMFGTFTRFSQFQKSPGIAANILSKHLEGFVAAGPAAWPPRAP